MDLPTPQSAEGGGASAKSVADLFTTIQDATASKTLHVRGNAVAWTESLPAQTQNLSITTALGVLRSTFNLPAGFVSAAAAKDGR